MIDATSYFELEAEEYKQRGVVLTPELWLVKLMVGAIDPTYDEQVSPPRKACFAVLFMVVVERLADSCDIRLYMIQQATALHMHTLHKDLHCCF